MDADHHLSAAQIRKKLGHPVIDADGHWIEFGPLVRDELRRIGGDLALQGYSMFPTLSEANLAMGGAEREAKRITQGPWWTQPTRNTYDRATVMLPRLLAERMDEVGFDYMVAYPSVGNSLGRIPDAAMRQATCHAFNIFAAELFRPYADRITPTAVIPMHTPEEAIAELEFVVKQLGVKVVVLNSLIPRSIDGRHGEKGSFVELRGNAAGIWYDTMAAMTADTDAGKAARTAMGVASGTDLAGFDAQLKATKLFDRPADAVAFADSPDLEKTMDLVRGFLFDKGLLGSGAASADVIGIELADGKVLGDKDNVKLRFSDTYMKAAATGAL